MYVDDIKLAGKKQNIDPVWNVLMKQVDLGEPTSFLDYVYLGVHKENAKRARILLTIIKVCSNPRFLQEIRTKLPSSGRPDANISTWSYEMEGHAKKCVERYCELANKTTQHLYKVSTPCLDDHQFKEEELGSVGELSNVVLKCPNLARMWSVSKLARAVTKWTRA